MKPVPCTGCGLEDGDNRFELLQLSGQTYCIQCSMQIVDKWNSLPALLSIELQILLLSQNCIKLWYCSFFLQSHSYLIMIPYTFAFLTISYLALLCLTSVYFEKMKNTLIHNCIDSHTNCFMSLLGQSSVTTNFEKALHKIKSQIVLE